MDAGECSTSKPPQPCSTSASSPAGHAVWAKLGDRPSRSVPADSAFPEVEVAENDAVVCSLMSPDGEEELAWCEIRRGGDASSATIRNLSSDAIIVDGRIVNQELVDIKQGSEVISGPQKEDVKDHGKNKIEIVLDIENAKCSICLSLWHDVVTVAPCLHNFWLYCKLFSSLQRSDEEIALLESYASVKSNIVSPKAY
ncbi:hypothetical protein PR202_ga25086 [Eleusine coracana subsp. coracana]|uniref:Uncharacterized protein n=1 Tax=Eleusine coracana subsp. coracana TaxID=191504 RepID=A0AAV5DAG0_ELECO|nr:hypothetical protein PR202_ga25086 [Eleusine coracana subsp. coracana]